MASVRPGEDYTPQQRLQDALRALGGRPCPRPDKTHWLTEQDAQARLRRMARMPGHDPVGINVYACPCGMGWVWGRRRAG